MNQGHHSCEHLHFEEERLTSTSISVRTAITSPQCLCSRNSRPAMDTLASPRASLPSGRPGPEESINRRKSASALWRRTSSSRSRRLTLM